MLIKPTRLSFTFREQVVRLGFLSAMCVCLLVFRIYRTDSFRFLFLVWNLFLAWVPLGIALLTYHRLESGRLRHYHGVVGWASWLLFFPNSPYIITDLLHLTKPSTIPIWYDSLMVFSYALVGLLAGMLSLHLIHQTLNRLLGIALAWLVVTGSMLLCGFGVFLGRFQRWNSWDIVANPGSLLVDAFRQVGNPVAIQLTFAFTLMLMLIYLTFVSFLQSSSQHAAFKHHS